MVVLLDVVGKGMDVNALLQLVFLDVLAIERFLYAFTHMAFRHTVAYHWEDVILMMAFVLITCTWLTPYVEKVPWLSGRYKKKSVTLQP